MGNRKHIIGLDKPVSRPLNSYSQPEMALRKQALEHERHRLECVAEMLALVGLMTLKQVLTGNEAVAVEGEAEFQFGQGVKKHGTVGAHCLPGKLNFNGTSLHEKVEWRPDLIEQQGMKPLPLSSKLRNLFGRVDVADASINNADSWVEKMPDQRGLKFHFGRSVHRLMGEIPLRHPATGRALCKLVEDAYKHYTSSVRYIYEERWDSVAHPRPGAQAGEHDAKRKFIVEHYFQALRDPAFNPAAITTPGFRELMGDVLMEGRHMISTGSDTFKD